MSAYFRRNLAFAPEMEGSNVNCLNNQATIKAIAVKITCLRVEKLSREAWYREDILHFLGLWTPVQ